MDITCAKCGHTDDYVHFPFLCKNGWPATGESDLRQCPGCGAECVFSRAEALEQEQAQMKALSIKLAGLPRSGDPEVRKEASRIILKLHSMNQRWNIEPLHRFLLEQQRELLP